MHDFHNEKDKSKSTCKRWLTYLIGSYDNVSQTHLVLKQQGICKTKKNKELHLSYMFLHMAAAFCSIVEVYQLHQGKLVCCMTLSEINQLCTSAISCCEK